MNPKIVLDNNYNIAEQSFLYYLHEKRQFNTESFWQLYDSIVELGKCNSNEKLNVQLVRELIFVYKNILECFLYHMDLKDLYKIEKFPQEQYTLYIERLDIAVDAFFSGYEINDEIFELKKPI